MSSKSKKSSRSSRSGKDNDCFPEEEPNDPSDMEHFSGRKERGPSRHNDSVEMYKRYVRVKNIMETVKALHEVKLQQQKERALKEMLRRFSQQQSQNDRPVNLFTQRR